MNGEFIGNEEEAVLAGFDILAYNLCGETVTLCAVTRVAGRGE
jgi:hypothetical protein